MWTDDELVIGAWSLVLTTFSFRENKIMEISVWELWLPVVVSGVALFIASWAAWMLLPHHKKEWGRLPEEDAIMNALKSANIPAGQFMFPCPVTPNDWKTADFKAKMQAGPNGNLVVWSGPCSMGKNMACTVLFFLVANFVIAYLAAQALAPGSDLMKVFQFVGTAGILTYGTANILNGIWFGRKMVADIVDGIVYGLITGAIFAAMWPAVAAA
jgi:hypothetical protein